jgi:SAM-dependent methyltransferase
MKMSTREYYHSLLNDEEAQLKEYERVHLQAGALVEFIGRWAYDTRVLDINSGIGAFPALLQDGGFVQVFGTEMNPEAPDFWEEPDLMFHVDPWNLPFSDKFVDICTWFSAHNNQVDDENFDKVLTELTRVSKGYIMGKFYDTWSKENHEDVLGKFVRHHYRCLRFNPKLYYYIFAKG